MSFRFMRLLLMFDLPMGTSAELRRYRQFRKFLISEGFIMEQFSVYSKLALNQSVINANIQKIRREIPANGKIQILTVTEKQYANMQYLAGEKSTNILDDTERIVVL